MFIMHEKLNNNKLGGRKRRRKKARKQTKEMKKGSGGHEPTLELKFCKLPQNGAEGGPLGWIVGQALADETCELLR